MIVSQGCCEETSGTELILHCGYTTQSLRVYLASNWSNSEQLKMWISSAQTPGQPPELMFVFVAWWITTFEIWFFFLFSLPFKRYLYWIMKGINLFLKAFFPPFWLPVTNLYSWRIFQQMPPAICSCSPVALVSWSLSSFLSFKIQLIHLVSSKVKTNHAICKQAAFSAVYLEFSTLLWIFTEEGDTWLDFKLSKSFWLDFKSGELRLLRWENKGSVWGFEMTFSYLSLAHSICVSFIYLMFLIQHSTGSFYHSFADGTERKK